MKKLKVGITFNLEPGIGDIWFNGANQNIIFLYQLLCASHLVEKVSLVYWGPQNIDTPPKGFLLDDEQIHFEHIDTIIDQLDLLIEGTLQLLPQQAERVRQHGGKVLCYKIGNDYIMGAESFIFNTPNERVLNGTKFDGLWILPHHFKTCSSYFSIMHQCEARVVPMI